MTFRLKMAELGLFFGLFFLLPEVTVPEINCSPRKDNNNHKNHSSKHEWTGVYNDRGIKYT